MRPGPRPVLPAFPVDIPKPDLGAWLRGNAGIEGVWSFASRAPGPHVLLVGLVHGNEIAGAIALKRLLEAGLRPARGRLSFAFANLEAFAVFDPADPVPSRYVDEDLNRVWSAEILDGPRRSVELARARALRPLIEDVDIILDLHSMLWRGEPLLLCRAQDRARRLAQAIGMPSLVVMDEGHAAGPRLIDYGPFAAAEGERTAVLVEAGAHWKPETAEIMLDACLRLLRQHRMLDEAAAAAVVPAPPPVGPRRLAQVTRTVTAATDLFAFVRDFDSGHVIEARNTLIALDGQAELRTPHDRCMLIMPALSAIRGQTAVRLARLVEG